MCVSPILIQNPNYLSARAKNLFFNEYSRFKDTTFTHIAVPCGKCPECLKFKQNSFVQRVVMESTDHYLFFATLTYDNVHLPSTYVPALGRSVNHCDYSHVRNLFTRLDTSLPREGFPYPLKHFAVSEYGGNRHRPHWHLLFSYPISDSDSFSFPINLEYTLRKLVLRFWSVNVGSRKNPVYEPLFTFRSRGKFRNFDLHYVCPRENPDNSNVGAYVSKYMLKFDSYVSGMLGNILGYYIDKLKCESNPFPKPLQFDECRMFYDLIRPHLYVSNFFGGDPVHIDYIKSSVLENLKNSPTYFYQFRNPFTGQLSPLSSYYRRFLTPQHAASLYDVRKSLGLLVNDDDSALIINEDFYDFKRKFDSFSDFNKTLNIVEQRNLYSDFLDL